MVSGFFPDKDLSKVVIRGPGAVHPLNSHSFIIDFGHVFVTISVRFKSGILNHQRSTQNRGIESN